MIWVCEYSPAQDAIHVDTLERVLSVNRDTAARGRNPGFVPLFLGLSSEEAYAFADRWRLEHCVRQPSEQ